MIYFNMTGALGAPKAIAVAGTMTDIVSDIALATAQVYHCQMDPMMRPIFKKNVAESFFGRGANMDGSRKSACKCGIKSNNRHGRAQAPGGGIER